MGSVHEPSAGHTAESDRKIIVAGAQLGPNDIDTIRSEVVSRMLKLLDDAYE